MLAVLDSFTHNFPTQKTFFLFPPIFISSIIHLVKMRFTSIVSGLALAAVSNAAMNASTMISNIDAITSKSSDTNDIAKSMSVTNFFSTAPVCLPSPLP